MNWQKQVSDFKSALKAEAPSISTQAIRFGFFGSVGGGKSVTAGIFAIGITPAGLIGWVDGEGRRSGWAIDAVSEMAAKKYGGTKDSWKERFRVVHIDPPFHPLRVVAATEMLEEMGCKTIIEDVMSQCWDSDGGYLDLKDEELYRMAGEDESKRNRSAASAAAHVKPWTHQKLVNKVTSSKCNLVLLFQSKQKFNAKTSRPDDFQSPIQESGLTRTALAVGRVECNAQGVGGFCSFELPQGQGTKFTHHSILSALPKNGEQFKFEHGEAILKLCSGVDSGTLHKYQPITRAVDTTQSPQVRLAELGLLKKELWDLTMKHHGGDKAAFRQWLVDEMLLDPDTQLDEVTATQWVSILNLARKKIA